MITKEELPECPVATTVQIIGNKWKLFIIQRLLDRPWRFNELARAIPGISEKVLAQNLKALEADGIVQRVVFAEVPPHTEYSLTATGDSMRPVIQALADWGVAYKDGLEA